MHCINPSRGISKISSLLDRVVIQGKPILRGVFNGIWQTVRDRICVGKFGIHDMPNLFLIAKTNIQCTVCTLTYLCFGDKTTLV